jgi:hypothetical protein
MMAGSDRGRGRLAARTLVGLAMYALLKLRGVVVVPFYARLLCSHK